jgi:hypothetical protein
MRVLMSFAVIFFIFVVLVATCSDEKSGSRTQEKEVHSQDEELSPMMYSKPRSAVIQSKADGFDVNEVNIWSSPEENRTMRCLLKDDDKIDVLGERGSYYFVESKRLLCKGYCMKGFVKFN